MLDAAVSKGDASVRLLSVELEGFAVRVGNPENGAFDVPVFDGPTAETEIATVALRRARTGRVEELLGALTAIGQARRLPGERFLAQ